jgi:hypothetical protein
MTEKKNDEIKINEKVVTQEELEKKKQEVEKMKDAQLVEIAPNQYKMRLRD